MPDGRVITGDKAVTQEIETLLGLSREQFSQIAMLAQGSFSRLLSGKTEDRGIIFLSLIHIYASGCQLPCMLCNAPHRTPGPDYRVQFHTIHQPGRRCV